MKKNPTKIALILLLFCFNGLFAQIMLKEISLKEQIDNSTMIVEGEVIAKKSFWSNNLIYTANTVKVHKVFKGQPEKLVEVITVGGSVGLEALMISHGLKLQKGSTGLFMLKDSNIINPSGKTTSKSYQVYSAVQGFYKYNLYDDKAVNPFKVKEGITTTFYPEIISFTNRNYDEVSSFNVKNYSKSAIQNKSLAPVISGFSPSVITAGTKSQLTITGSGFGVAGGVSAVKFPDADDGGSTFVSALDTQIVSWSDTEIIVEVPSGAGTGKLRVTDAGGASGNAATDLTILYSELNREFDPGTGTEAYPLQHYAQNFQTGGYQWKMQTDFFNDIEHPGAKASFERAMETWRCNTLINWTVSTTPTIVDVADFDGTNVIRFDDGPELPNGVLGTCYTYTNGCVNGSTFDFYVVELDIVFNDTETWYFGTGDPGVAWDFESVAVHELGHGHQLGHVIDTNAIMHYSLSASEFNRILSTNDIDGASDVQARSTTNQVCLLDLMTDYAGTCSLSVNDAFLNETIRMYPNPSNGQIFITHDNNLNLTTLSIFELSGRKIADFDLLGSSNRKEVNLQNLSKGMYLVNIYSDTGFVTKKLILE